MFTIDLLKGQGIPIRSRPEGIAIAAATFAVPVVVAIVMFGFYLSNSVAMSVQKREILNCETKIDKLSGAVEMQRSLEKEKDIIGSCLAEVSTSIDRHTQWSPILTTLVRNMPDSVVLTKLSVKQRSIRRKVPRKDDPKKMIDATIPVRVLQINVSGDPQHNCDKAIRDFRDRLRFSTLLGPELEDIRVSQKFDRLEGRDVVSYEIDCVFKPGL